MVKSTTCHDAETWQKNSWDFDSKSFIKDQIKFTKKDNLRPVTILLVTRVWECEKVKSTRIFSLPFANPCSILMMQSSHKGMIFNTDISKTLKWVIWHNKTKKIQEYLNSFSTVTTFSVLGCLALDVGSNLLICKSNWHCSPDDKGDIIISSWHM